MRIEELHMRSTCGGRLQRSLLTLDRLKTLSLGSRRRKKREE